MSRREFPRAVRVTVIKRATKDGVVYCEKCGALAKRFQIDHIIADAHGGKPTLENAMLICQPCWEVKNPADTTIAARIKSREAAHVGARTAPVRPLKSAPFAKSKRAAARQPKPSLPPKVLYR